MNFNSDRDNSLLETAQTWEFYWLEGSIHSCVSSLKHIHFAIINHFLFNCNVSKMAAHSERKTQTANFRAVQNFAKSNWQETAQLHTFAHSVTKVRTFWETHKIWKNLPHGFDKSTDLLSKHQNHGEDFFKLCVLLKNSEL